MSTKEVLAAVRHHMTQGEVAEAVDLLAHLWSTDPTAPHHVTLELADRFPLSPEASTLLDHAVGVCTAAGALTAAAEMARRKLAIWRARCQADPGPEALDGHLGALDALARVHRAQGNPDGVIRCLAEVMEWQLSHGHRSGVAWAMREMGAVAWTEGDLDTAVRRLTHADEVYGEVADDPEVARERAECRVLLGRVRRSQGDDAEAHRWFTEALDDLEGPEAAEVHALLWAMEVGSALPEPVTLTAGEFGRPTPVHDR